MNWEVQACAEGRPKDLDPSGRGVIIARPDAVERRSGGTCIWGGARGVRVDRDAVAVTAEPCARFLHGPSTGRFSSFSPSTPPKIRIFSMFPQTLGRCPV